MVTIDSRLSSTAQSQLWMVNIKTAIIRALKSSLDDKDYPDKKIQGIKISMDYPMEKNVYPHLWLEFSFTKFQQAGIGHVVYENNTLKEEWYFEGVVKLNLMALSSYERDTYASQLIQLLAFGSLNPITAKFIETLHDNPSVYVSINRDTLVPGGQSATVGAPWDTTSSNLSVVYEDSYSFQIVGQIESTFTVEPEFLRQITVTSEGTVPGVLNAGFSPVVEEFNGGWQ